MLKLILILDTSTTVRTTSYYWTSNLRSDLTLFKQATVVSIIWSGASESQKLSAKRRNYFQPSFSNSCAKSHHEVPFAICAVFHALNTLWSFLSMECMTRTQNKLYSLPHCCFYLVWTICRYKFAIFDTTLLWILLLEALQQKGGFKLMFNSSINSFIDPLR